MKYVINGKDRECKLRINGLGQLALDIEGWTVCVVDPTQRKLHLVGSVSEGDTGLKITKSRRKVKLGATL